MSHHIVHKEEDSGVDSIITNNSESTDSGSSSTSQSKTFLQQQQKAQVQEPKTSSKPKMTSHPRQSAAPQKPVRSDQRSGGLERKRPGLTENISKSRCCCVTILVRAGVSAALESSHTN